MDNKTSIIALGILNEIHEYLVNIHIDYESMLHSHEKKLEASYSVDDLKDIYEQEFRDWLTCRGHLMGLEDAVRAIQHCINSIYKSEFSQGMTTVEEMDEESKNKGEISAQ